MADAVNTAEILRLSKNKEEFERVMKPVLDLFRMDKQESTLLDMCPMSFLLPYLICRRNKPGLIKMKARHGF